MNQYVSGRSGSDELCRVEPQFLGIGRIGEMNATCSLLELARKVQTVFNTKTLRFCGDPALKISRVAFCTGSGGSLVEPFLHSSADVYISGDIGYHHARDVDAADRGVIDVGHFASEQIVVEGLSERLRRELADQEIEVIACRLEKDPFTAVKAT